ncbi:MAG: JAB domain-containing protein [Oceanicoccus sp.]|uniref:RadC family protein n=1 Tax=Oceanicoccus sp. TaxID=2691044 RepID=UPI00263484C6|nr:DNA repair protein RadC [Oceanicoccus sp.]MCP3907343.1 JAB domain-containing protein [Oceanicoccus sp.]MDG1772960.1 DNA repair protein RadC [Oceanicoccus sp.]
MAITDWPSAERPREKLIKQGPAALSDAELLAIFLRTGTPGLTAVDLARLLIKQYGSLRELLDADLARFCEGCGLGEAKYTQLQAVLEMSRRHMYEQLVRGDGLTNPRLTRQYLESCLKGKPQEQFCCLFMDSQHRVIVFETLFYGTIDGASVYPREVVRRCLHHHAAAVILAHNHPSGVAEPSQADMRITRILVDALKLVDIRVLDHFVVGDGEVVSFAERGLI